MAGNRVRRWTDFLNSMGFLDSDSAKSYVESASHTPGGIVEIWSLNQGGEKIFRFRKHVQDPSMHPELGKNKKIDGILWPRIGEAQGQLPGVTLVFDREPLTNSDAVTLGEAVLQHYNRKIGLHEPPLKLAACNIQYVLVEYNHPRKSRWPARISPEVAKMLENALDMGVKYLALFDKNTSVGLDLDRSKVSPEERWEYLQSLSAKL